MNPPSLPNLTAAAAWAISAVLPAKAQPPAYELPPACVCQRTTAPIIIDGRADEADWRAAIPLQPLRDIEGTGIPDRTCIRLLWDDSCLYVHATMQEEHVWASQREHDSVIYQDPDFEVFIDPDGDGCNYLELEVNALGTTWDLFLPSPYRSNGGTVLHDWDMKGLRHAVHIDGTLNDPSDTDCSWSVEIAIPWRCIWSHGELPRRDSPPPAGTTLRMNFSRVGWQVHPDPDSPCGYSKDTNDQGHPLPESNHVWAPTGEVNIHLPEYWGRVILSHRPAGIWEAPAVEPDDALRLGLFAVYRAQLAYRERMGHFAANDAEWQQALQQAGCELPPGAAIGFSDAAAFLLRARSPYTGRTWYLNQDGRLHSTPATHYRPTVCLWVHGEQDKDDTELWASRFTGYADAGIDTVIIDGAPETIAAHAALAQEAGLRVFAWCWVLNRPGDEEALRHPDWYAVSRTGKSCFAEADRPYVPYYQFLCPNHPDVRRHLRQKAEELATLPGISGVQLDYMRLPDVILPRGLWSRYGLDMTRELPPYDFCYCTRCRDLFTARYGRAPANDPATDTDWREFRLASIAELANELADTIRRHHRLAACAVFPTPEIATRLVRQDWSRFRLDLALPMLYHSFYAEPVTWISTSAAEASIQTEERIPQIPGLHLPDISPQELPGLLDKLIQNGATGIGLFSAEELTPDHLDALRHWRKTSTKKNKTRPPNSLRFRTHPDSAHFIPSSSPSIGLLLQKNGLESSYPPMLLLQNSRFFSYRHLSSHFQSIPYHTAS